MKPASASPVASPIMFCSATPALKKRSGCRADESVERHEADVAGEQHDPAIGGRELGQRLGERHPHSLASSSAIAARYCVVRHRKVMPLDPAFHEGNALAEHGPAQQRARAAVSGRGCGRKHRGAIVAVHLDGVPAETGEAVDQGSSRKNIRRIAERLLPVHVDKRRQAVEPVMGGEHQRFPQRTLVAFGIAQQRIRPTRRG